MSADPRATIVTAALAEHEVEYTPTFYAGTCECRADVNPDTFPAHQAAAVLAALDADPRVAVIHRVDPAETVDAEGAAMLAKLAGPGWVMVELPRPDYPGYEPEAPIWEADEVNVLAWSEGPNLRPEVEIADMNAESIFVSPKTARMLAPALLAAERRAR